ncbi:MAG: hypothetical protein R8G66_25825 [Cytophagales bacterium]|nr:hypothetical protein [Cytophagales bacterium]
MYYTKQDISTIEEAVNFNELPQSIRKNEVLESLDNQDIPEHHKDFVGLDDLKHRDFVSNRFWDKIPAFKGVSEEAFLDMKFQNKHTVRKMSKLEELTKGLVDTKF